MKTNLVIIFAMLSGMAIAQNAPDAKYILPGMTEYYRNAATDALSARSYALQCVDQFEAFKAEMSGPTKGPDDSYYTGD